MSSTPTALKREIKVSIWPRQIRMTLLTIVLLVFTLIVIVPFIWMILMSVRTTGEILLNPYGLPKVIRWQNYYQVIL